MADNNNQDQRLAGIKEGAGLEDAKINEEFIAFLQKWGGWALTLAAVALGIVYAYQFLERRKAARIDDAFQQYEFAALGTNPSPDTLREVANATKGVRSVSELATLQAADLYLRSAISGTQIYVNIIDINSIQIRDQQSFNLYQQMQTAIENETALNADGTSKAEDQLLTEAQRTDFLNTAMSMYQSVATDTAGNGTKQMLHIGALFGVVSVAESTGDMATAQSTLKQIQTVATSAGFAEFANAAQMRLDTLDDLSNLPTLFAAADLPKPPPVVPDTLLPSGLPGGLPGSTIDPLLQLPSFDPGMIGPLTPAPAEDPTDPIGDPDVPFEIPPSLIPDATAPAAIDPEVPEIEIPETTPVVDPTPEPSTTEPPRSDR